MDAPLVTPATPFQLADWVVLAAYFAVLVVTGYLVSRRPATADAYFVGERQMPPWAVALSVLATALSAATFIGGPQQSYAGDLTYLSATIGAILAVLIVGWFFIPVFYRYQVVTVYELLGRRFGPGVKMAASWTFVIGRVFANGSRLFIAAAPAALLLFGDTGIDHPHHLYIAIAVVALVGIVYTLVGGIASIIWTDVIQIIVLIGATLAAAGVLLHRIPIPVTEIVSELASTRVGDHSKLAVLSFDLSPGTTFTVFTAITGWVLFNLAAYGTDQDLAQRMLTCKDAVRGGRSALFAILMGIPVTMLFMAIGLLLYLYYQRPDLMGAAAPTYPTPKAKDVFLSFIHHEMPQGLRGLMMAGLFSVAFASLLSALNAMASAFVNDFYRPLLKNRPDRHYLLIGRLAVVGWGIVLALFACACVAWWKHNNETLIEFALGVMTFAYSGLLAVFLTTLFTRRGTPFTAISSLVMGFAMTAFLQPAIWYNFTCWILPDLSTHQGIHRLVLASPWRLLIATAVSLAVCVSMKDPRGGSMEEDRDPHLQPQPAPV
ncbi:MAG: sodium/solute symporter [Planctomycetes bacterium]|nr:sodium/solute symporter [Planctomycetota bacterium]